LSGRIIYQERHPHQRNYIPQYTEDEKSNTCYYIDIKEIIDRRKKVWDYYRRELKGDFRFQMRNKNSNNNFGYFPLLFKDIKQRDNIQKSLNENGIFPRKYFYPSLDTLDYIIPKQKCEASRDIASRILCLPMYPDLGKRDQDRIIKIIKENL